MENYLKRAALYNILYNKEIGKRAWNSGFNGGMGKRAWNSGFTGNGLKMF
jgi:hypothetical protein